MNSSILTKLIGGGIRRHAEAINLYVNVHPPPTAVTEF